MSTWSLAATGDRAESRRRTSLADTLAHRALVLRETASELVPWGAARKPEKQAVPACRAWCVWLRHPLGGADFIMLVALALRCRHPDCGSPWLSTEDLLTPVPAGAI